MDSLARRPGPAVVIVVLLHLVLLLALSQARVRPDRQPAEPQSPVWLMLPSPWAAPPAGPTRATAASAQAVAPRQVPATAPRAPAEATMRRVPAAPTAADPVAPAGPGAEAPAVLPLPPRPLNLSLPRGASAPYRHPALDDPRSNTLPPTLEGRLAEVMGASVGPITQEYLPDGSLRLRRGTSCAIVRPSRAADLDPFNQSVSPKPRQIDGC